MMGRNRITLFLTFVSPAFLVFICTLLYSLSSANINSELPKIVIQEQTYNFGTVRLGDKVEHTYRVKNIGQTKLVIKPIKFQGPLANIRLNDEILPGQEGTIVLTLATSEIGEINTVLILQTNDPVHPEIKLEIIGKVKAAIEFQPVAAFFLAAYKGEKKEQEVTIINNDEKLLKIFKMGYESKRFTPLLQTLDEGKEYKLVVKLNPDASFGKTVEQLTLYTDNPEFPEIKIPVNIFIKKDVYTFPDLVDFGRIDLAKLKEEIKKSPQFINFLTQFILVKRKPGKGKDFQIRIEHDISFIQITKEVDENREAYKLDVSLVPEKLTIGKIDSFIRVITNDKGVPELKILVKGEVI